MPTGPVVPEEDFAVVDDEQRLADADAAGHQVCCGSGQANAVLWKTLLQNLLLQEEEEDVENEGVLTVVTVENQVNGSEISPILSFKMSIFAFKHKLTVNSGRFN